MIEALMATGHEHVTCLIQRPSERPLRGTLRNFWYGCAIGIVLLIGSLLYGGDGVDHLIGFIIVGDAVSFSGWGAERLWYSTIAKMVMKPFSLLAYATRIPFWYMAGGIGYTMGMLIAKKLGLLTAYDIPVKNVFDLGGWIGVVVQVPLQVRLYWMFVKKSSSTMARPH